MKVENKNQQSEHKKSRNENEIAIVAFSDNVNIRM
jgi:hypothetical protein